MDDIAARVGMSQRTFFRYFATKEDAALGPNRAFEALLTARLEGRVAGRPCGGKPNSASGSDYQRAAYGIPEWEWPAVLGLDVVGLVDAVGEHVTHVRPGPGLSCDGFFTVEERRVPGPHGAPGISLLICRPAAGAGGRPVLYHVHGGGMIVGNNRSGMDGFVSWARELDLVVVSVEYRLAPEHPHPAPVEDVYAGLVWTAEHAEDIGGDPERIVVAGHSAGGGLTAALSLLSRDREGPRPLGQMLFAPMLDDRNDTPSGVAVRRARTGTGPVGPAPGLPGRRFRGNLPRRGRHLRFPPLAVRRGGRTPRLARRLPRLRGVRARCRPLPRRDGRPGRLAAAAPGLPRTVSRGLRPPPSPVGRKRPTGDVTPHGHRPTGTEPQVRAGTAYRQLPA
ncbi:hypothetical protein GCM10010303_37690 [Streptomyces purpurascens]|nr:hypothetical protein GCM10010303_37690 [Streptomyces purpurascens]